MKQINQNNLTDIRVVPGALALANRVSNSLWSLESKISHKNHHREEGCQKRSGRNDIPIIDEPQFNLPGRGAVAGSNEENRLFIIFKIVGCFL